MPARLRLLTLSVLGNFGGAVLSFPYFSEIDMGPPGVRHRWA